MIAHGTQAAVVLFTFLGSVIISRSSVGPSVESLVPPSSSPRFGPMALWCVSVGHRTDTSFKVLCLYV